MGVRASGDAGAATAGAGAGRAPREAALDLHFMTSGDSFDLRRITAVLRHRDVDFRAEEPGRC